MRIRSIALAALAIAACGAAAKPAAPPLATPPVSTPQPLGPEWAPFRALVGHWSGTGGDAAHRTHGGFTLAPDLGGTMLVRRGTNDAPGAHHEDLTIIYRTAAGELQASYFDNEGHAIHYAVTADADGKHVVFLSDDIAGTPRFRLTYALDDAGALAITFELAPPGGADFKTYTSGVVHRDGG